MQALCLRGRLEPSAKRFCQWLRQSGNSEVGTNRNCLRTRACTSSIFTAPGARGALGALWSGEKGVNLRCIEVNSKARHLSSVARCSFALTDMQQLYHYMSLCHICELQSS